MLFDPNSDVVVEYCGYGLMNGSTLEEESDPQFSSHILVIVTGTVH